MIFFLVFVLIHRYRKFTLSPNTRLVVLVRGFDRGLVGVVKQDFYVCHGEIWTGNVCIQWSTWEAGRELVDAHSRVFESDGDPGKEVTYP